MPVAPRSRIGGRDSLNSEQARQGARGDMMRAMKTPAELEWAPIQDLERWANDPTCAERTICIEILAKRLGLQGATTFELEKWSQYPGRADRELCAEILAGRLRTREAKEQAQQQTAKDRLSERRRLIQANRFDPRTEVSADAFHIAGRMVTHMWIIFVLLPVVLVILLAITGVIK
jgi:hypothetical protein